MAPLVAGQVPGQGIWQRNASVVEEQVEPAETGTHLLEQGLDLRLPGQVGRDREGIGTMGAGASHGVLQGIGAAANQHDRPSFDQKCQGTGPANA